MKIIDRYLIRTFLKNYLIGFGVLVGMYVVLDMIFNFQDMVNIQAGPGTSGIQTVLGTFRDIGDFYFYRMFVFFVHLSGIIPVVAAAFTLMRLSRFNELTAMLAAGTPLLRIAMPILLVGLVLNGLLIVDQEWLIPNMSAKLIREHDEVQQNKTPVYPIRAMQAADGSLLTAARYHPPINDRRAWMEYVDIIERDAEWRPIAHLSADRADWDPVARVWQLSNGRRTTGLLPNQRLRTAELPMLSTSITPDEIALYKSSDVVEFLSTERINRLLEHPESYGRNDLLRVKHWRFTQPLANFILLLLAIPCVLTREPGRLKMAALKCVVLTGICMTSLFLAHQLAGSPPAGPFWENQWAALMAWFPLMIFAPLSVFLLDRVKT